MAVYTKDSKVSELIFEDPTIMSVLNRFGINLGVGDRSIEDSCVELGLDVDFFIVIINTYLNNDYLPEKLTDKRYREMMIEYLEKTDIYYRDVQLPNITRHFGLLLRNEMEHSYMESDKCNSNLQLLNKFFIEVKEEFHQCITGECDFWFPLMRRDFEQSRKMIELHKMGVVKSDYELPFEHIGLEDKLRDLISFFVIHLHGVTDHNLCLAVVSAAFTLEKDIRQNNRIRNRIFRPLCEE